LGKNEIRPGEGTTIALIWEEAIYGLIEVAEGPLLKNLCEGARLQPCQLAILRIPFRSAEG
jgi:hypothetical protein